MIASAIILAAGIGERMRSDVRKGFLELAGRPLFMHSVQTFADVPRVTEIILVVHSDDLDAARSAVAPVHPMVRLEVGGATRRESSIAGIRAAKGDSCLIHDACRPFVSPALIERVLDAVERHGAAVPVLPATETLYRQGDAEDRVGQVLDRSSIVRAQTPQGFRRPSILRCLEEVDAAITDDVSAVIAGGMPVFMVEGEPANLKITYPEDLRWAEAFARRSV